MSNTSTGNNIGGFTDEIISGVALEQHRLARLDMFGCSRSLLDEQASFDVAAPERPAVFPSFSATPANGYEYDGDGENSDSGEGADTDANTDADIDVETDDPVARAPADTHMTASTATRVTRKTGASARRAKKEMLLALIAAGLEELIK